MRKTTQLGVLVTDRSVEMDGQNMPAFRLSPESRSG